MTPAITLVKKLNLNYQLHDYHHDPTEPSYGHEAANKLGVAPERVFKTLVVNDDQGKFAVTIVPVSATLNLKSAAKALGSKKVQLADAKSAERTTGYMIGGISPLGQKKRLTTVIDVTATTYPTIYVSAGRRGLEIELSAQQLAAAVDAQFAQIADSP